MAAFGELLAELRQERKLTQKQLGEIIFVSAGTISNYENGTYFPDIVKLVNLADYFNVTTDYLLGRCTSRQSPDIFKQVITEGKTVGDLVQDFRSFPADRQKALLLIMRDMEFSMMVNHYSKKG